jgi:multiple sugar transport system substrate-binding protein
MSSPLSRRRFILGTAAAATSAWFLSGCSSSDSGGTPQPSASQVPQSEIDKAMDTETTLTFWTWVPDIKNQVDMFMKAYPKITVNTVNVGQGAPHYQKLRTAIQSGEGGPDVTQMEFQYIPSFTLGEGALLDLTPYAPADTAAKFPEWVWGQVSANNGFWGVPQDTGPMGLLYRDDLLSDAGIEAPKTWDDYAAAAETYHSKNPKSYLVNVSPSQAGQIVAYMWQLGAKPFAFDGAETVTIDLASDQGKQVAQFWGDLVTSGVASVDTDFTDQWYQGLANGKYASWPAAAWGPVFLQGTAGKTSGKWRASELPQWGTGAPVSANWGGSTDAVLKSSKNPIAASQLALWINTNPESTLRFATEQFLFPATNQTLTDPAFTGQEAEFYGGQKVNELFAGISETVSTDFGWLPFMDYVYSQFNETIGKAFASKTDAVAGLQAWQDACVKYAQDQGFTVA